MLEKVLMFEDIVTSDEANYWMELLRFDTFAITPEQWHRDVCATHPTLQKLFDTRRVEQYCATLALMNLSYLNVSPGLQPFYCPYIPLMRTACTTIL